MTIIKVAALMKVCRLTNIVEYNEAQKGITVTINHKVFFGPEEICQGYPEDFFLSIDESGLEEIGFEFVYGMNAY